MGRTLSLPKDDFAQAWTERDTIRDWLNWTACVQGKNVEEKDSTLCVIPGGPKYIFYKDGTLKSVIKNGESYGPDGKNVHYKAREK
jgi:hypothetical protein